jgi:hypothetical protein
MCPIAVVGGVLNDPVGFSYTSRKYAKSTRRPPNGVRPFFTPVSLYNRQSSVRSTVRHSLPLVIMRNFLIYTFRYLQILARRYVGFCSLAEQRSLSLPEFCPMMRNGGCCLDFYHATASLSPTQFQ